MANAATMLFIIREDTKMRANHNSFLVYILVQSVVHYSRRY